ncbi:MAG: DUF2117 domain-containing protein [Methanomicrobiaceae archaeon]|nr:DUF2117 domain-containing protein [Methanomicrobiaceae archaeon]
MIVHGPLAFDAGDVARLTRVLAPGRLIVAGVMARTAAEEQGIPFECPCAPPSAIIRDMQKEMLPYLLNHGKTPESGRVFGEIVASRLPGDMGLVHIETSSDIIYVWNGGDREFAAALADRTGYALEYATASPSEHGKMRRIRGCRPGEPVFVNGTVIGIATAETAVIESLNNMISAVSGLITKPHGIEKVLRQGSPDLSTAWCKSGAVRSVSPVSRTRVMRTGRIAVIDHAGHTIYDRIEGDICGVLAVGDDTTAICGHICSHHGIPVFGVVDDDADGIVPPAFSPGSVVVKTLQERDDDVGAELARLVTCADCRWDAWVSEALGLLGNRITIAIDLRNSS